MEFGTGKHFAGIGVLVDQGTKGQGAFPDVLFIWQVEAHYRSINIGIGKCTAVQGCAAREELGFGRKFDLEFLVTYHQVTTAQ